MSLTFVLVPWDESKSLEEREILTFNEKPLSLKDFRKIHVNEVLHTEDALLTALLLPSSTDNKAGLYAFHVVSSSDLPCPENIRATRLAMAFGHFSKRFRGDVILLRAHAGRQHENIWCSLSVKEIYIACCISPDLRTEIQQKLLPNGLDSKVPEWLANASQLNYHDAAIMSRFMKNKSHRGSINSDSEEEDSASCNDDCTCLKADPSVKDEDITITMSRRVFVAQTPLCLHCRRPADNLCSFCEGAYFCQEPRLCRQDGWSHRCLCATWKIYTDRRGELSDFPFDGWHIQLVGRDSQISEVPCLRYLLDDLGASLESSSWWRTEIGGWAGGESDSAQTIDVGRRWTFQEGFAPVTDIPPERFVTDDDLQILPSVQRNTCGLLKLTSWEQYYLLRSIPSSSPAALLLTFPLTIYFAIQQHGEVPVTVARMLKRSLRIHVVGVEKEINFLDLFKEVSFLLPRDLSVELVFVVREDMLPMSCRDNKEASTIKLTCNLTLHLVSGTYGDTLDPSFDCGSGPPDIVIAMNAGLFAYESWRSVVEFLHRHNGVVGVFTDYNEHSGMNCASLGGAKSRESLKVNPFRQPRALPVYSMNLPQLSNAFMYVYNEQKID